MAEDKMEIQPAEPLQLTPVGQWKQQTWLAKLPFSGYVVRIKSISLMNAIRRGTVPNTLLPMARKAVAGGSINVDKLGDDGIVGMLDLMAWVVMQCVVSPQIWDGDDEAPEGAVPITWLSDEDQAAITNWVLQGASSDFAGFCPE